MIKYLWDPANAITTVGLLCSSVSLFFALSEHLELAVAMALWAVLSDHLDGLVAANTKNRDPDAAKMGKSLDGFGDMIYGAVLPAAIVIQISHASLLALATATALLVAGAIRLSYFANFGKSSDGRFLGLPLSYDVPLLALLFLLQPLIPAEWFAGVVNICFSLLAVAHVASIRVPSPNMTMYAAVIIFAVASAAALAGRSFQTPVGGFR
ncbi:CDP-alcohol phosphatidyltransferase family protein [Bradyrhizobium genosp. A]|uniref:CDP-alcohol phosphatidyltransferase family protein n=1 Tax=Bradyrhizobium genosp. A TaxID=83626 RepID=UPI003CEF0053